jgi:hydroxypyruvate reductase/glycerate 2-kinase
MLFKNQDQIIKNGQTSELKKIRKDILEILSSANDAVNSYNVVKNHIIDDKIILDGDIFDINSFDNIYLIGFGKASIGMAQAICDSINVKMGAVITNDTKNKVNSNTVQTYVGTHPIPSQTNISETEKLLDIVSKCNEKDLLIILISGGGSALLCKPRVNLDDLQKTTDLLLKCGANINEVNTVRKHLSFVKGGRLASLTKCTIISFIISDIIGDPIEFIASGPTSPDSTTFSDAENILKKFVISSNIPSSVKKIIIDGKKGDITETPKQNQGIFNNVFNYIVANNKIACYAAKEKAEELGYKALLLTTSLDGEASDIGKYLVEKTASYITKKDTIFISGGETTVTIKGKGKGGRNQEMVLGSVDELENKSVVFSSFATDGIDGISDAAGAIADGYTKMRSVNKHLNTQKFLEENNSYEFFKNLEDIFITGSTGTNVMDLQILVKIK